MTAVSVISSHSRSAGRPQPASAAATCSGNAGSASCRADTFTDSTKSGADQAARHPVADLRRRGPQHPFADRRRSSRSPPRRAMKAVGWTTTSVPGRRHRTSASTPHTVLVARSTIGWYWSRSSLSLDRAAQRDLRVQAGQGVPLQLGVEDLDAVAAELLRAVHRRVRVRRAARPPCAHRAAAAGRHADRERDRHRAPADARPGPCSPARMRSTAGSAAGASSEVVAQHHELVAAEAG